MILHDSEKSACFRPGVALMLMALMMPCFFGLLALTIDLGQAMESRRLLQATADCVALSVVNRANRGFTPAQQLTHANTLRAFNMSSSNPVAWNMGTIDTINNPPRSGAFVGNTGFYEVILSSNLQGIFAPIIGVLGDRQVVARAVCGLDDDDAAESILALDPCANPGIALSGNATLSINGAILTNSGRGGQDQYGNTVNLGLSGSGIDIGNNNSIRGRTVSVRGGVNASGVSRITNFVSGGPNPLIANLRRVLADPLASLPIPNSTNTRPAGTTAIPNNHWNRAANQRDVVSVTNGQNTTISPGIYADISVNPGGRLTLNPGVYIISPTGSNQGFRINGSVTGSNVMIYLTSSNFTGNSPGANDVSDGPLNTTVVNPTDTSCSFTPATSNDGSVSYSTFTITPGGSSNNVNLSGITDPGSPFYRILVFQRRRNTNTVTVSPGSGSTCNLNGVIYSKWAPFSVGGNGSTSISNPMAVARFTLSGGGQLNITSPEIGWKTSQSPFLVE